MIADLYTHAPPRRAPLLARLTGKRHRDSSYRYSWGELAPHGIGFALNLYHYDEPGLAFAFLWPRLYIKLPEWGWIRRLYPRGYDVERSYGFSLKLSGEFAFDVHWHWGEKTKIFHPPWGWNKRKGDYRREYLDTEANWRPQLSWAERNAGGEAPHWEARWPYHYMTSCGEAQHVTATVQRARRRDIYRIFGISVRVRWTDLIEVEFGEEVGNQRGSWKGGVLGCSYIMKPLESASQTLRRMQRERNFDR